MTVLDLEITPLDRRVPGHALAEIVEQLPEPRSDVGWHNSDQACQQVLTWPYDPRH